MYIGLVLLHVLSKLYWPQGKKQKMHSIPVRLPLLHFHRMLFSLNYLIVQLILISSLNLSATDGLEERERVLRDKEDVTKKVDVESMLMVEKGLRELSLLKVYLPIVIPQLRI